MQELLGGGGERATGNDAWAGPLLCPQKRGKPRIWLLFRPSLRDASCAMPPAVQVPAAVGSTVGFWSRQQGCSSTVALSGPFAACFWRWRVGSDHPNHPDHSTASSHRSERSRIATASSRRGMTLCQPWQHLEPRPRTALAIGDLLDTVRFGTLHARGNQHVQATGYGKRPHMVFNVETP